MQDEYAHNMSKEERNEAGFTEKNLFTFDFAKQNVQDLEGKVLTLIEAVIPDRDQAKAVKDLVRGMFSDKYDWLFEAAFLSDIDTDYSHLLIPLLKKPVDRFVGAQGAALN